MHIGKHKLLKISAAALTLIIVGIAARIYYAGSLFPDCDEGIMESQISPDGKWVAEKTVGICGGAMGVTYLDVYLHDAREHSTTILDMDEIDSRVTIKWADPKNLVVTYPAGKAVHKQQKSVDDVALHYVAKGS